MKKINGEKIGTQMLVTILNQQKLVILKSIKIPPVGGDTCFSNMELSFGYS